VSNLSPSSYLLPERAARKPYQSPIEPWTVVPDPEEDAQRGEEGLQSLAFAARIYVPKKTKRVAPPARCASEVHRDPSAVLRDSTQPTEVRVDALRYWVRLDPDNAATFVVEQLERADLDTPWCRALVFATDHLTLANNDLRARLSRRLLSYAQHVANRRDEQPALWAALRQYASIAQERRANDLLPFLDGRHASTRQSALQAVQIIFSSRPPAIADSIEDLRTRIGELARIYLDRDFMTSAENGALALNLFLTAAAVLHPDLDSFAQAVVAIGRRYLTRQARLGLLRRKAAWAAGGPASDRACGSLEHAGEILGNAG
jgi:hypothetical protein